MCCRRDTRLATPSPGVPPDTDLSVHPSAHDNAVLPVASEPINRTVKRRCQQKFVSIQIYISKYIPLMHKHLTDESILHGSTKIRSIQAFPRITSCCTCDGGYGRCCLAVRFLLESSRRSYSGGSEASHLSFPTRVAGLPLTLLGMHKKVRPGWASGRMSSTFPRQPRWCLSGFSRVPGQVVREIKRPRPYGYVDEALSFLSATSGQLEGLLSCSPPPVTTPRYVHQSRARWLP